MWIKLTDCKWEKPDTKELSCLIPGKRWLRTAKNSYVIEIRSLVAWDRRWRQPIWKGERGKCLKCGCGLYLDYDGHCMGVYIKVYTLNGHFSFSVNYMWIKFGGKKLRTKQRTGPVGNTVWLAAWTLVPSLPVNSSVPLVKSLHSLICISNALPCMKTLWSCDPVFTGTSSGKENLSHNPKNG